MTHRKAQTAKMSKDSRGRKASTSGSVAAPAHLILWRAHYSERENIRSPKEKVTGDARDWLPFFLPPEHSTAVPGPSLDPHSQKSSAPKGTFPQLLINTGVLLWPLYQALWMVRKVCKDVPWAPFCSIKTCWKTSLPQDHSDSAGHSPERGKHWF